MSDTEKTRREIDRPHMKPRGVQSGTQGVYVGSLMGYKKYVLYTVEGGEFEPITTIDTPDEADKVAAALEFAARLGGASPSLEDAMRNGYQRGTGDV